MPPLAPTNLNYAWAFALVEHCISLGVTQAVLCPGSRNTPLIVAFAEHPKVEALSALDERSAAFFALGLAKRSRQPVALVCTSGTAVANFYPAVMEAFMAHVPLLVFTADRPSTLRYCSARQTVNQLDAFNRFTRFAADLALPAATLESFAYLRQILRQAYEKALTPDPGPVHLNIPFDEPLDPRVDPTFASFWHSLETSPASPSRHSWDIPFISQPSLENGTLAPVFEALLAAKKGLIVLGSWQDEKGDPGTVFQSIQDLANLLPWPILADVISPLRYANEKQASIENLVTAYDYCLAEPDLASALEPDRVLQLGPLPNSKSLNTYLAKTDALTYILNPYGGSLDPHHRRAQHLRLPLASFVKAFQSYCKTTPQAEPQAAPYFSQLWRRADALACKILKDSLENENTLFDGKVAYELGQMLPPHTQIVLANSRTVRNAEQFFFPSAKGYRVYFNGGVNGSDGISSTALGIAHKRGLPTVLLIGDLAFLHDSNALLLASTFRGSLSILIVNNNGGGIFEQLPIAQHTSIKKTFETYIATPQHVDIAALAAAYGCSYKNIQSWDDFRSIAFDLPGIHLFEIKTDRTYDATFHSKLFERVCSQLRSLVEEC